MFTNLFLNEDGTPFDGIRKYNAKGKLLCEIKDCYNVVHDKGKGQGGLQRVCRPHYKGEKDIKGGYRFYKKDFCENIDGRLGVECTATITYEGQLTVDHIDEDHFNNNPVNLQTICHNCHAIKTAFYGNVKNYDTMIEIMDKNRRNFT